MRDRREAYRLPVWPRATMYSLPPGRMSAIGAAVTLVGAVSLAILTVRFGPLLTTLALGAVLVAIVIASDVRAGLWVVLAIAALLPYAVIPVKVIITPPILELVGLSVLGVWLLQLFLRRDVGIPPHPVLLGLVLFLALTLFAFVLGIGRGYTTQTYHDYAKFLISSSLFFVAWSSLRTLHDFRRMTVVFLGVTSTAALVGLALYAGGPTFTLAVLARLVPYGYPTSRIVRFIEDDPTKPMRLTSTSVDPNSFAGLLALAFVVGVAQFVARRPVVPRWLALVASVVSGLALLLTYSRAGWLGAAFGIGIVAIVRYRWLLLPGGMGFVGAIAFGIGEGFFQRLWQGFTLQDRATQMRLEEYRTALAILREYPAFGVGFGQAPTVELWTGVSSIYLLVAERMGLLGLGTFLLVVVGILGIGWRAWRQVGWDKRSDLLVAWLGAQGAALLIGLFDHYYMNISFPHMVLIFWFTHVMVLGLAVRVLGSVQEGKSGTGKG